MIFTSLQPAAMAAVIASVLSLAQAATAPTPIPTPASKPQMSAMTYKGCYSSSDPLLDYGPYTFQTSGNCQPICWLESQPVMALVNGTNCYCGPLLPLLDDKVSDDECNTPCNGYDKEDCGGNDKWAVYLVGLNKNSIANYDPASTIASKSTKANGQVVTVGGQTVIMTVAPTADTNSSSGGPSKAGIAAGVVVGVLALAGIIGGVFFFLRYKKRKAVEEEYRRAAAINEFVGKAPGTSHSSLTDSRLDPEVMFQRRQSDGSIADNQDYSRRILQVRNPDGH